MAIIVGVIFLAFILYFPVIFQEGNPLPQLSGILQLTFGGKDMVALSAAGDRYLTRSKNGQQVIEKFMADKNYQLIDQLGSGYIFQTPDGKSAVTTRRQYSRFYIMWQLLLE